VRNYSNTQVIKHADVQRMKLLMKQNKLQNEWLIALNI